MAWQNGPFGAGSQLASLSLPGDSFWMIQRQPAVGIRLNCGSIGELIR